MKSLIIATNNQGKVREIKAILGGFYDEILSLKDANIHVEVVEDGKSFHENAAKKAIEISLIAKGDVLADDSGLCVEALDNAPGIYSARFAGTSSTDKQNNDKLLELLKNEPNRKAKFVCALVIANDGKEKLYVEDSAKGEIIDVPKGQNGFGYDPLFYVAEYDQTFAQIPAEIKNKISHRAKALEKLKKEVSKMV